MARETFKQSKRHLLLRDQFNFLYALVMKNLTVLLILMTFIACGKGEADSPVEPIAETPIQEIEIKNPLKYVDLISPSGEWIKTTIASTNAEKTKGLQGVKDSEFAEDQGMLFFYLRDSARSFWMPNTFFNLDIIYLDRNMKITDIVWNLAHYTGNVNSLIPRAPSIIGRHVLEMKAGPPISSTLQIGDTLQWKSSLSLREIESKIREL
jgi:uncharacterized membrane protein (UPF0127 family)